MGSVVFPDARLSLLTAGAEGEGASNAIKVDGQGMSASMSALFQEIRDRDARDSARTVSPLQKCADAIVLDTTTCHRGSRRCGARSISLAR